MPVTISVTLRPIEPPPFFFVDGLRDSGPGDDGDAWSVPHLTLAELPREAVEALADEFKATLLQRWDEEHGAVSGSISGEIGSVTGSIDLSAHWPKPKR